MSIPYIILGILIFGVLIATHELGHFLTAKAFNVKVEEFAIGMGPAVFKRQKGETLYALRCIPIGGYCLMTGEDGESDEPRAFVNQKLWKKLIILCAGAFTHFILGFLIVVILYSNAYAFRAPIIESFIPGCPYENEDLFQVGDRFVKINGKRVYAFYEVSEFLNAGDGSSYDFVLKRNGKKIVINDLNLVKQQYEGYDREMFGFTLGSEEATIGVKLSQAWDTCMGFSRSVWEGLEMLFTGKAKVEEMSGPVGIVDYIADTGENSETVGDAFYNIFYLVAFMTINLAIMNLLPFPALDGGRIFLLIVSGIIETITRRKLDPKYEAYINAVGMAILLTFMVFIMFNDIVKLIK